MPVTIFYEDLNDHWKTLLTLNNTGGVVSADIVLAPIPLPIDYSMWQNMDTKFSSKRDEKDFKTCEQVLMIDKNIARDWHEHSS